MNLAETDKYYGEILKNLKEELICLTEKIKEIRNDGNWGTYKNLISAYKEILNLYDRYIYSQKEEFKEIKPMYIDVFNHESNINVVIYYDNEIISLNDSKCTFKDYASIIHSFISNKKVIMYIDTRGFGIGLYDELNQYRDINLESLNINNNFRKCL